MTWDVIGRGLIVGALCTLVAVPIAFAETLQSPNYRFSEPSVGAGSLNQSSSASYIGQSGLGDLGVGNAASSNFQINAGSKTNPDPTLSVAITSTLADFGNFSASTPSTATASFTVINYSSYGYAVQLTGSTPTYNGHSISPMATTAASQPGTEQFGINAVLNTSPSVGADPVQVPSGSMSFDTAASGYNTSNRFQYRSGDIVASSPKQSGETDYTVSMIINISNSTPAGQYSGSFSAVVIPNY